MTSATRRESFIYINPLNMDHRRIPLRQSAQETINAIIEIPTSYAHKFKYGKDVDGIKLNRVLHLPMHHSLDYGPVPQTHSDSGNFFDVMITVSAPLFLSFIIAARPPEVHAILDEARHGWKIIAIPDADPATKGISSAPPLGNIRLKEAPSFFK